MDQTFRGPDYKAEWTMMCNEHFINMWIHTHKHIHRKSDRFVKLFLGVNLRKNKEKKNNLIEYVVYCLANQLS
jgi:hypothetical protein